MYNFLQKFDMQILKKWELSFDQFFQTLLININFLYVCNKSMYIEIFSKFYKICPQNNILSSFKHVFSLWAYF